VTAQRLVMEADLHAYVDGELSGRDVSAVRAHLAQDEAAAARAARWAEQRDAMRARLAPVADEALPLRLRIARMKAASDREDRGKFLFAFGFVAGFGLGVAIVGALLLRL